MNLVRGQRLRLDEIAPAAAAVEFVLRVDGVEPRQWRFLALALDAEGRIPNAQALAGEGFTGGVPGVAVGQPEGTRRSFLVEPPRLPGEAQRLTFALVLGEGGREPVDARALREGEFLVRVGGREVARFAFCGADFATESVLLFGELYRKDGWRLTVPGTGFVGGLPALLSRFRAPPGLAAAPLPQGPPPPAAREDASSSDAEIILPTRWPGQRAPQSPSDLRDAVGLVLVETADGATHSGTGFVVSPGGFVLTCQHVIAEGRPAGGPASAESPEPGGEVTRIGFCLDGTERLRPAVVVRSDPDSDLALLWLADRNGAAHWFLLSEPGTEGTLGQRLGLFGYPLGMSLGLEINYSEGIINSVRTVGPRRVLQIDAGAAPGSSGGPVYDRSTGRVLGVLSSGLVHDRAGMHINFAVDVGVVWRRQWFAGP